MLSMPVDKVTQPSPQPAEMARYNDCDVSYASGIANVSVPLVQWSVGSGFPKQCYNYTYDRVGRLTAARLSDDGSGTGRDYSTTYRYDLNSNITALTRRGPLHAFGYGLVDDLTMEYDGDRVTRISDAADHVLLESSLDFDDGADSADEIAYDANGNMIRDLNRGISCIRYNASASPS
ncbi:MAG: hypothetical protein NC336_03340 [Clostridium sp.]|nr:hypothetical protein [Clostridium sp.]